MVSVLSGPIYDLGYYRTLVYSGCLLSVFGFMMLSLSTQYYQLFLSHTCNGIGSGLLYVPTLALVAQGHGKTRSLAMGIVASGIALGRS
jgi:MFS family permease